MIVDGWLHTGDIGHLDEDGYVHLVDRRKDMIKPGGYAVWPREVEEVISAHPDVVEVGVAGVPDAHQGEAVKAWVVLRRGSTLSADDLRSWTRERLAPYKVPRQIEFRDVLPRSHVGKVLRRDLVDDPDGPRVSMVNVNGANLSVEERGRSEESIVFAHGVLLNGGSSTSNSQRCRIAIGASRSTSHGRSEVPDDGYAVDALAEDAAFLIRSLGYDPCHFVGHSLGAFVGLRHAARHPELIRSLVLISPSADAQPRLEVIRCRMMQAMARRVGLRPLVPTLMGALFSRTFLRDPDRATERETWRQMIGAQSLSGALHAVDGVLERASVRDELARITAPTLIVVGEQDPAAPLRLGKRLQSGISRSELVTVPAGHTSPVEQPEAVTGAIERFLAANRTIAAT